MCTQACQTLHTYIYIYMLQTNMLSLPWSRTVPPWEPVKRASMARKSIGIDFASLSVSSFLKYACATEILLIKYW